MAWEKRSLERQEFLRELMSDARREEDRLGSAFFFQLAKAIHDYLEVNDPRLDRLKWRFVPPDEPGIVGTYLRVELFPRLRSFARTGTELDALMARLLESLTSDIVSRFDGALRRDELTESEEMKIFGAHRTAEVELEFT